MEKNDVDKAIDELKNIDSDLDYEKLQKEMNLPKEEKSNWWLYFGIGIFAIISILSLGLYLTSPNLQFNPTPSGPIINASVLQNLTESNSLLTSEKTKLNEQVTALQKQINETTPVSSIELDKIKKELDRERQNSASLIDELVKLQAQITNLSNNTIVRVETVFVPQTVENTPINTNLPSQYFIDFTTTQLIEKIVTSSIFPVLKEGKLNHKGKNIGYKEILQLKELTPTFTTNPSIDSDFDTTLALMNERGSVEYRVEFDEPILFGAINPVDPLKFTLANKNIEITQATTTSVTISTGRNIEMLKDEIYDFNGVKIKLMDTTDNKAVFKVNTEILIVATGETKSSQDIDIKLKDVVNTDSLKIAQIIIGSDVDKEVKTGDKFTDNENYTWAIKTDGSNLQGISLKYDERNIDKDDVVFRKGEYFNVLDYFKIRADWNQEPRYSTFNLDFGKFGQNSVPAMRIRSLDGNKILIANVLVNEIWVQNNKLYYTSSSGQELSATNTNATINVGDLSLNLVPLNGFFRLGNFAFVTDGTKLGNIQNQDEALDFSYNDQSIGTRKEVMSPEGILLNKGENQERIDLKIPNRRLDLRLYFVG